MGRRNANKRHIERFIIFYDRLFPSSVGFINLEELEGKPESNPPIPERAWEYLEDPKNRQTALYLRRPFGELAKEKPPLYYVVGMVGGWLKPMLHEEPDHGLLRRWKAGETEKDRAGAQLFDRAINFLEERLNDAYPKVWIDVKVPRRDDPCGSPREHNDRKRTWEKEDSYRLIGAEVARVIQEEECGIQAAKGLVAQRTSKILGTPCSFRRVEEAWLFYQNEIKGRSA